MIGNQSEAGNGHQRIRTVPELNMTALILQAGWVRFLREQKFLIQVHAISGIKVFTSVILVLGLNWPRELKMLACKS